MTRTQIQLTDEQHRLLKAAARRIPVAEIVRRAVDRRLAESTTEENYERALQLLGAFEDSRGDVSEKHDDYLKDIWEFEQVFTFDSHFREQGFEVVPAI